MNKMFFKNNKCNIYEIYEDLSQNEIRKMELTDFEMNKSRYYVVFFHFTIKFEHGVC